MTSHNSIIIFTLDTYVIIYKINMNLIHFIIFCFNISSDDVKFYDFVVFLLVP